MAHYYLNDDGSITTEKKKKKKGKEYVVNDDGKVTEVKANDDDIAPVKKTTESERKYGGGGRKVEDNSTPTIVSISEDGIPRYASKEKKRTWFDKGVLDDGYQFGDITKGILGTGTDATTHIGAGLLGIGEKLADAGAMLGNATYQTTYMQQAMQDEIIYNAVTGKQTEGIVDRYLDEKERSDEATAEFVAKDLYNEEEIAKKIISAPMKNWTGIDSEKDSFFGDKTDALAQSGGQLLGQVAVSAIPGVGQPFAMGMMGASALGSEAESAFKQGATYDEALFSGLVSATAEVVTEKIGGISFGGKTLTDKAVDLFSRKATTKLTRALVTSGKLTADGLAEGGEELLSGYMSALGQKLSYMEEKEIEELFNDDDKLESFIGGLVLGGTFGGVSALASDTNVNGMTKDEQSVVDKVYNDAVAEEEKGGKKLTSKEKTKIYDNVVESVQNGSLGIEVIEEALGGESYDAYKKASDENTALKKERDELNKIKTMELTGEQSDRLAELKRMNLDDTTNLDELGKKWKDDVYNRLSSDRKGQGSLLLESYRERERRGQAFTADLTKYEGKQREAIERAINSGVLNNTNRSHELVGVLSKIEADKGIIFDYTDNKKLKESGFAIDGKTINGFVKDGSITLNMQSSKAWESTVGHEITHVLEGTKVYSELQTSLFEYAKSKGEFDTRKADIMKLYEKVENADIDGELTAELISDYLFNDKSFINHLTGNRTVFQKVWDEVKYLYKVATGKEKASIEKVMREFDRAWKEMGKGVKSEGTKYSVSDKNIKDESTGYGYGETYFTMSYNQDGKTVATLEYGEYEGTPNVKMVKVDPEYRRQGIATKLLQELQKKYPDTEIDFGMTTPDGTKLLESITYDVTDDTVVAKQNEYKALQAELDELQGKLDVLYDTENLTEAQEEELEKLGDRWTEVYDAIRKLEPELRGKNATKTFVKYSVSEDSEGNQLSKEQSEYFKDSLVRDDNGNLLKVYHGSGSEFTVFNHKYLNTHGNSHGRGFYFTEKKSLAEGYSEKGGQLLEGYLNITKPLAEDKVTMKKADLVKLIKATCKAEAQEYVADGGYETVAEALPDTWISNYVDTYSTNLNDAYREVADIIYSGNDNDVEIISEITNAGAGNENTLKLTKDVLGYDGVIYTADDGTHEFVSLVSEQFKSADNINPTDNPDIRFSLSEDTKKLDSEYMLAVENGDMETTQRIVDEAAKSAGYDIKAYHGTGYDFTVFDKSRQGNNYEDWGRLGKGFYFAPTSREAETWAELSRGGKNKVMPVYLRSENMLDSFEALPDNLKDTIPENWDSLTRRLAEKYAYNYIEYMQEFGYNVQEILTEKGYDGINGHTEYVVFDPEQVKSADAITYDDKGNVIPLSERFNKGNEDIRYSLSYENTAHSTFGTPLRDLYLEQDIAPIREDVAKNATATPKAETYIDDYAPITAEEAEAINKESFEHIGDKDIPPEMEQNTDYVPDRIVLDTKSLKQLTKAIGEKLPLTDKFAKADLEKIIQDFSTGKIASKEGLVAEVKKKFNTYYYKERNDEIAKIKESIRKIPVYVSDNIKGDFGKGKDGYFYFMQKHFGKIKFSKDGLSVDRLYDALTEVYPGYFSADVWNDAERLRVIADVVDTPTTQNIPQPVDDRTLEDTADFIYDSVQEYKGTVRLTNALDLENAPIDESLVPPVGEDEEGVAPAVEAEANGEPITPKSTRIADGTRSEELLVESLVNYPMQTVEQKVAEKIRSVEAELADKRDLRREAENDYNNKIANLQKQYADKKDKSTLTAYNLLQSISRLKGLKARADADYAKRISDLEARLEKMKEPTYTRAMQKQAKMQEHAKFAENLLGDTSTWVDKNIGLKYEVNTERRNLRDIVRDENGNKDIARADAIYDALMGEYNRNHAELNRKDNEISKKYHDLKITRAESVYANMLGELRHNPESKLTKEAVAEYYEKHKEKIDVKKVDKVIDYVRADLDYFFETLNAVLREQGMKEIPYRKGYFPHATFPKQGFIAKLLNWKVQDNEIPTSIAGLTEDFKPVKSYQSFDKQRHGDKTDYDIMQMFEKYKDGALDWIYHIEDIQKRRAVENYIRSEYSEEGIQARIKEVYASEDMDADEAQTRIDEILSKSSHLSHFVQDFMTKTNILANKKNSLDRAMEQKFNRNIYSVMQNVQNRTSANMVLANIRSALTNFIPITQSWAQVSPLRSLQATKDVIANAIKDDGMVEKSTFLTNRLKQADKLYQTNWDKILDKAGIMFEIVDNISSQVIWRSKYNQNLANGMSEADAIANADQFAENVMAGRSKGNEPTLFNAKNPLIKAFTTFQLEVNNQYGYYFKDVPNDLKAETNHWKFNLAKGYTTAFIGAYVYNALLSKVTGSDAALDPIGIIEELLRDLGLFDDDEEKEPDEVITNFADNVIEELPFVGGIFGGGRIPISSAMPYGGEYGGGLSGAVKDVTEGNWKNIGKEMMKPLLNVGLPVGGGQLKKTVQGLKMFNTDEEHPVMGSYTDSGALRFPVEDTLGNRIQAGLFGQYANENAREYFDNGYDALNKKQIQEYQDVDLPIADYWKYREGLKGLKTNGEKADFINSLDIADWQKNILMNNILDRKEDVDMTNYDDYADFEEFDWSQKNPEKYDFFKTNGVSYSDYANADEDGKDAYNWAYNNPEKFVLSKAVTDDVITYRSYTDALFDIKADKDASGKTISGSAKAKKRNYIFSLKGLDYGQKAILYRSLYDSKDDKAEFDEDIVYYINGRNDLTDEEKVTIYTELGFTVKDGYVYW